MNAKKIREDFPILKKKIHGKRLAYLDNTATTQKPKAVIDALTCYYEYNNANVHRGAYELSQESSDLYDEAHKEVSSFVNSKNWEEIIFTRNTTESLNLLAFSLGENLKKGDVILSTVMEHHSNIVPWQQLRDKKGIKLKFVKVTKDGQLDEDDLKEKLKLKPKIFTFTGASNVLGTINDFKDLTKQGKENNAITIMDAAQVTPHLAVDVKKLDIDFIAFSGHKMLGPTGIGVLYGKKELLDKMPPFITGGDMISSVTLKKSSWNKLPWKFEAGTPSIADAIGLRMAIKYLKKIGLNNIIRHEEKLLSLATEELEKIKGITIYGPHKKHKLGIISFNMGKVHPHDVSTVLDQDGVQVRSGNHCAQPLMQELGMTGTVRASFYLYNDEQDVAQLIDGIKKVKKIFRV